MNGGIFAWLSVIVVEVIRLHILIMMGDIYVKLVLVNIFLAQDVEGCLSKMIMKTEMLEMDFVQSVHQIIKDNFVLTAYQTGQSNLSLNFA